MQYNIEIYLCRKLQASVGPFSYSSESNSRQTATECLAQNNRRIDPAPSVFRKITPYSACTEASKESNFTREPSKSTPSPDHADGSLFFSDLESEHQLSSTPIPKKYTATSHFNTDNVSQQFSELIMKCSELESRLKKQTDVNKELKRLLVASIGSNLQNSLNHLAQEKAVISHDLNISLEKLAENHEEIDRVSIECDIWRSKFLASRVMIDEIAGWKAQISQQLKESQRALQCILKEHAEINKLMFQSNHCLNEIGISLKLNEMDRGMIRGMILISIIGRVKWESEASLTLVKFACIFYGTCAVARSLHTNECIITAVLGNLDSNHCACALSSACVSFRLAS